MKQFRIRMIGLALPAICSLCVLFPTASFASLNSIACAAIWRGCTGKCTGKGGSQSCYDNCDANQGRCMAGGTTKKQRNSAASLRWGTMHNPQSASADDCKRSDAAISWSSQAS